MRSSHLKENKTREQRIEMEVVVDAYNAEERAMGWYCYLEEKLKFPFKARCKSKRAVSPFASRGRGQCLRHGCGRRLRIRAVRSSAMAWP